MKPSTEMSANWFCPARNGARPAMVAPTTTIAAITATTPSTRQQESLRRRRPRAAMSSGSTAMGAPHPLRFAAGGTLPFRPCAGQARHLQQETGATGNPREGSRGSSLIGEIPALRFCLGRDDLAPGARSLLLGRLRLVE